MKKVVALLLALCLTLSLGAALGEDKVELYIKQKTAEAGRKDAYESTPWNLVENWFFLGAFILLFALMSVISLELIDRDKR